MKMMKKILISAILVTIISACDVKINFSWSTSSNNSSSISDSITSLPPSTTPSISNSLSTSNSISSSSNKPSNSNSVSTSTSTPINLKTLWITKNIDAGSYDTNWGTTSISGYDFEFYRAGNNYSGLLTLQTQVSPFSTVGTLEGMLYNTSPIYGIHSISITYRTASATKKPILRYGDNKLVRNVIDMDIFNVEGTCTLNVYNCNFFKIETNQANMLIKNIEIQYSNEKTSYNNSYLSAGLDKNRLNPVGINGKLVDGVSKVNAPIRVEYKNDGNYRIIEEKEYTYYSYDYVASHPNLASSIALVDPRDVAIYFNAFKTYPANYVDKSDYNDAYDLFGEKTRCVSQYNRTDGYALSVPYATLSGSSKPIYFECDIALDDSYSSRNRGSGRVVVWLYGFDQSKAIDYDDSPVSIYTDDHYSSFCEYLNDGTFGHFFNAEQSCTPYVWGCATTLN